MRATDEIAITLPLNIDNESSSEEQRRQLIDALSKSFRDYVKRGPDGDIDEVISTLTVKEINGIFFNENANPVLKKCYYQIIEDYLSTPNDYKDEIYPIVDGYLETVKKLRDRAQELLINGVTCEDDEDNKTSTASYLDTRLTSICERTKLILLVYEEVRPLEKQLKDTIDRVSGEGGLVSKANKLEETLSDLNDAIYIGTKREDGKESQGIKSAIDHLSQKVSAIDATSDKIMPNIVTLLGVFSSIIVVILTLITTSSTWLSNANEDSVLIAFVIPSAIATLTVCALTAFIRPLIDSVPETTMGQSQGKVAWWLDMCTTAKRTIQRWGLWFSVAVIALLVVFGTMWFCKMEENNKTHYIVKCLPMSETVDPSNGVTVQPTSGTSSPELFIIYDVTLPTREIYHEKILCSECDKHEDGYVYYCLLHKRFE